MARILRSTGLAATWIILLLLATRGPNAQEPSEAVDESAAAKPTFALSGTVVDAQDVPLAGATVRVRSARHSRLRRNSYLDDWIEPVTVQADDEGRFVVEDLNAKLLTVHVDATGHAPRSYDDVQPGQTLEVRLASGRRIDGTVRLAGSDRPLADARVTICDQAALTFGTAACRVVKADDRGRFGAEHLSSRELELCAVAAGYAVTPIRRLPAGEEPLTGLEIGLKPGVPLVGRVVNQEGDPVEGAQVLATVEGERLFAPSGPALAWRIFSDADGSFRHDGLERGKSYGVKIDLRDHQRGRAGPLLVPPRGALEELKVVLPQVAKLSVRVEDPDGNPASGVGIRLEPTDSGAPIGPNSFSLPARFAEPDGEGGFVFRGLDSGTFDFLIEPEGLAAIRRPAVQLRAGKTTDLGTLVAERGRELGGRVSDDQGAPIPGARLEVSNAGWIGRNTRRTVSDEAGSYEVAGLDEGELSVRIQATEYATRTVEVAALETRLDITLKPTSGVVGTVTLEDGAIPRQFTISLFPEASEDPDRPTVGQPLKLGFRNPDGSYRIDDLDPGPYSVEADASDWAPERRRGVVVKEGKLTEIETIVLTSGRTLTGRVIGGDGGSAVSGATLELRERGSWMPNPGYGSGAIGSSISRDAGEFELRGLVAGEYVLVANHPDFAPAEQEVRIPEDGTIDEVVLTLSRGGQLTGTVRDRDGRLSPNRQLVLGKSLIDPDQRQALTDGDGVYRFDQLAAGSYQVRLLPVGSNVVQLSTAAVVIEEGQQSVHDFEEGSGILLRGTVLRGNDPVANALLVFSPIPDTMEMSEMRAATSDFNGEFELRIDTPGDYRVMVQSGPSGSSSTQVSIPDEPEVYRDVVLEREGISGVVRDEDGAPVRGAAVSARRIGGPAAGALDDLLLAESDVQGRYTIEGLEAGSYRVTAVAAGFRIGVVEPVVVGDVAVDGVDLTLERGDLLRGMVVDPDGRPVAGAFVLAAPHGSGDAINVASGETDVNGSFELTAPADGLLEVTVLSQGWAPLNRKGLAAPDPADPSGLVLRVDRGGRLRIRIVDAGDRPLPGLTCSITPLPPYVGSALGRMLRPASPTDGRGETLVDNLAPGRYTITVAGAPGFEAVTADVPAGVETPLTLRAR